MKLLSISTRGVGVLPDREWSFTDESGDVAATTVVTGGPSVGKTTLLEAILAAKELAGAYGALPTHLDRLRRPDVDEAVLVARWRFTRREVRAAELTTDVVETTARLRPHMMPSELPVRVRQVFADTEPAQTAGGVAWFHATRAMAPGRAPMTREHSFLWLLDDNRRFDGLVPTAARAIQEETAGTAERATREGLLFPGMARGRLDGLRASLAPFLCRKTVAGARSRADTFELTFVDRSGFVTTFEQLGAQEKQGVLLAMALLARPVHHGLILIDAPELHVHPAEQAKFISAVLALAPDAQAILASSSPGIAPPDARVVRLEGGGA
ncbi:MAG TPA: hypothetical protein VGM56_25170 [Byssovorax sp.]|jgi:hypothetical protein